MSARQRLPEGGGAVLDASSKWALAAKGDSNLARVWSDYKRTGAQDLRDELIVQYAPGEARAQPSGPSARPDADAREHWVLGHAQRQQTVPQPATVRQALRLRRCVRRQHQA